MSTDQDAPPVGGFGLTGAAAIAAMFRGQANGNGCGRHPDAQKPIPFLTVHQAPIKGFIPITAGAGSLTAPNNTLGPPTGFYWSVRRLSVTGFTAGVVYVLDSSVYGNQVVPYPLAATNTFGRGEVLLAPDSYLVFLASGITTAAQPNGQTYAGLIVDGTADLVHWTHLQSYLE